MSYIRLAGDNMYDIWLFMLLSLVMSLMVSYFVLPVFPLDVLDEIPLTELSQFLRIFLPFLLKIVLLEPNPQFETLGPH